MKKKAIVYDLDNTLYPVAAIGEKIFKPVFDLLDLQDSHKHHVHEIKAAMMKTPFRLVAQRFGLSDELTQQAIAIQEETVFNDAIATFEDYPEIKTIEADRYLVTTGFLKMQMSKIKQMGIDADFKEIHVVDPTKSSKKEVFEDIMKRHGYTVAEMLIVGDDVESEIKAANELGIETVLYNKDGITDPAATYSIKHFSELKKLL